VVAGVVTTRAGLAAAPVMRLVGTAVTVTVSGDPGRGCGRFAGDVEESVMERSDSEDREMKETGEQPQRTAVEEQ
jgi:hypothetical protein